MTAVATVIPEVLCVGAALPDPPFEFMDGDTARGGRINRACVLIERLAHLCKPCA